MSSSSTTHNSVQFNYKKLWLSLGVFWVLLVLYLSLTSNPPMPKIEIKYFDKIGHFIAYFWLMAWYANMTEIEHARIKYLAGFIIMGICLEGLQSFNPQRSFEYMDMIANSSGALIAYIIIRGRLANILTILDNKMKGT